MNVEEELKAAGWKPKTKGGRKIVVFWTNNRDSNTSYCGLAEMYSGIRVACNWNDDGTDQDIIGDNHWDLDPIAIPN